jgi:hypothetical protein
VGHTRVLESKAIVADNTVGFVRDGIAGIADVVAVEGRKDGFEVALL